MTGEEKLITLGNLAHYDSKIKQYIQENGGGNGDINAGEGEGSIVSGESSEAISKDSVALGTNVIAGSKAFYIEAIDKTNKKIYLRTTGDIPTSAATQGSGTTNSSFTGTSGYAVGDEFSVANGTHYGFCGTIIAIEGNVITYDYYIMAGTLDNSTLKPVTRFTTSDTFATIASVSSSNYWKEYLFWVPAKPEVGFSIVSASGEEYFQGATAFGDNNKASANAAFVAGTDNVIGGKGANVLGTRNRGAYGNLISGGDNFSNGLHSMVLGRHNTNLADYNFIANRLNVIGSGSYSLVGGYNNKVYGGYNLIGGTGINMTSTQYGGYNVFGGLNIYCKESSSDTTTHDGVNCNIGGGQNIYLTGKCNLFGGDANTITKHYNVVGGNSNTVKGSYNIVGGLSNNTDGSYNVLFGTGSVAHGSYNILGGYSIKQTDGDTSNCSIGGGSSITFKGQCQIFSGKNHNIIGDLNAIFGEDNDTTGTHNITGGAYHDIGNSTTNSNYNGVSGYNNTILGNYNLVGGFKNTVNGSNSFVSGGSHTVKHSYSGCLGYKLTTTAGGQLVVGQDNETSSKFSNDAFTVAYGNASGSSKTLFTVSKTAAGNASSGWYTKPTKSCDAITYGYLQEALLNGEW